jgi:MFS family permease
MRELSGNYKKIFWIEALFYVNFVNLISTLFYLERGLTLPHVFWLAIIYSITNTITEIPSSYLADFWGRKKTIVLGGIFLMFSYIVSIFSHNFLHFAIAFTLYSASIAFISGTNEALLYDTNKELGKHADSFKKLSQYLAAKHFFKIFATVLTGFIAVNLTDNEFILVYALNAFVAFVVIAISLTLVESRHSMDVSKMERGILIDSLLLFRRQKLLRTAMFNKTLIFISSLIVFMIYQKMFIDLGLTLSSIGIIWSIGHLLRYSIKNRMVSFFSKPNYGVYINNINNIIALLFLTCILLINFFPNGYLILFIVMIMTVLEGIREPLFSHYYNHLSHSYNRATTLSMTSMLKNFLDIPFMLLTSILVTYNQYHVFTVSFFICLIVIIFFRVPELSVPRQN